MTRSTDLEVLLEEILCHPEQFLGGVQDSSAEPTFFLQAIVLWGQCAQRHLREFVAILEPCVRQSMVMALLPKSIFDPAFTGTYEAAIDEHLSKLGLTLSADQKRTVRDVCINIAKVKNLDSKTYRRQVFGISDLRARPVIMGQLTSRQNNRCIWCGTEFSNPAVMMTLEHVTPKHLAGDHHTGKNWALACKSCNEGKKDVFAWPASATAHDFLSRNDFCFPNEIGLPQRWAVLMRCRSCEFCGRLPKQTELKIYRRIETGLPIPANCSIACELCLTAEGLKPLAVRWCSEETGRS